MPEVLLLPLLQRQWRTGRGGKQGGGRVALEKDFSRERAHVIDGGGDIKAECQEDEGVDNSFCYFRQD